MSKHVPQILIELIDSHRETLISEGVLIMNFESSGQISAGRFGSNYKSIPRQIFPAAFSLLVLVSWHLLVSVLISLILK